MPEEEKENKCRVCGKVLHQKRAKFCTLIHLEEYEEQNQMDDIGEEIIHSGD